MIKELLFRFPEFTTLKTSSSPAARTFGSGTDHFPAFSFRFCLIALLRTLDRACSSRSSKYAGTASEASCFFVPLTVFCWCARILNKTQSYVFWTLIFSKRRALFSILALRPLVSLAALETRLHSLASFLRLF